MRRTGYPTRIALNLWIRVGSPLADSDTNLGPRRFPAREDWRQIRANNLPSTRHAVVRLRPLV
jgi:hypothetical protein